LSVWWSRRCIFWCRARCSCKTASVLPVAGVLQPPARSVAGIAINEGRFFIARRKPGGSLGEKWEFPGGKVKELENDREALKREYLEEFGVTVEVGALLAGAEFSNNGKVFLLKAYRVFFGSLNFRMTDHTEWRWAAPDKIDAGSFVDSDWRLLPALRAYLLTV